MTFWASGQLRIYELTLVQNSQDTGMDCMCSLQYNERGTVS